MKFLDSNEMDSDTGGESVKKGIFWLKVSCLVLAIGQVALAAALLTRNDHDAYDADTDYGPVIHWTGWTDDRVSVKTNRWSCGHLIEPDTNRSVHGWVPTGCGECERKKKQKEAD